MITMHWVSPKLSDLQMNETSNFPFRLESIVHPPLSFAQPLHRVSPRLSGNTVGKSASFVTLHLRDQNLHCFLRNRRSASVIGSRTSLNFLNQCLPDSQILEFPSLLRRSELGDLLLQTLSVHQKYWYESAILEILETVVSSLGS